MSDYPRERNGYVDDGSLIRASNRLDNCPNCGSSNYRETISMEKCEDCGLCCDYWGDGTNKVFEDYLANLHWLEEQKREEERRAWDADESNWRW